MGELVQADFFNPTEELCVRCAELLLAGGVVLLPTDSVYGLVSAATPNNPGYERIFAIKARPRSQALPLFVRGSAELERLGQDIPSWAYDLAESFWPGALTLVVKSSAALSAEYGARWQDGSVTLALRSPAAPMVQRIMEISGVPLAQTSANLHGESAADSAVMLSPELLAQVDLCVDSGTTPLSQESTIVDATSEDLKILRRGALTLKGVHSSYSRE